MGEIEEEFEPLLNKTRAHYALYGPERVRGDGWWEPYVALIVVAVFVGLLLTFIVI